MQLTEYLDKHKDMFRRKIIEKLSKDYSISAEQVSKEFADAIENFMKNKYHPIEPVVSEIYKIDKPIILVIRRDRSREDKCKICESNEPILISLGSKYQDKIKIFEISEDNPEGRLYHIIYQDYVKQEEKLLPLIAIIYKGDIRKYWAGKTIELSVYDRYLKEFLF